MRSQSISSELFYILIRDMAADHPWGWWGRSLRAREEREKERGL